MNKQKVILGLKTFRIFNYIFYVITPIDTKVDFVFHVMSQQANLWIQIDFSLKWQNLFMDRNCDIAKIAKFLEANRFLTSNSNLCIQPRHNL